MYQIHFQIGLSDTRLLWTSWLNKMYFGEHGEPACLIPLGTAYKSGPSWRPEAENHQNRLNSGFVLMNVNIYYQRRCAPWSDGASHHLSSCLLPTQVPMLCNCCSQGRRQYRQGNSLPAANLHNRSEQSSALGLDSVPEGRATRSSGFPPGAETLQHPLVRQGFLLGLGVGTSASKGWKG